MVVTLKENWAFSKAYKKGDQRVSSILVTYVLKTSSKDTKIGITTSKKIGNAVNRVRCRRIIRAALKNLENEIKPGFIVIFVARTKTVSVKSTDILSVMSEHLREMGVTK